MRLAERERGTGGGRLTVGMCNLRASTLRRLFCVSPPLCGAAARAFQAQRFGLAAVASGLALGAAMRVATPRTRLHLLYSTANASH